MVSAWSLHGPDPTGGTDQGQCPGQAWQSPTQLSGRRDSPAQSSHTGEGAWPPQPHIGEGGMRQPRSIAEGGDMAQPFRGRRCGPTQTWLEKGGMAKPCWEWSMAHPQTSCTGRGGVVNPSLGGQEERRHGSALWGVQGEREVWASLVLAVQRQGAWPSPDLAMQMQEHGLALTHHLELWILAAGSASSINCHCSLPPCFLIPGEPHGPDSKAPQAISGLWPRGSAPPL